MGKPRMYLTCSVDEANHQSSGRSDGQPTSPLSLSDTCPIAMVTAAPVVKPPITA